MHFVNILPPVVRFIIHAAFYLSILGIILTQIRAMFLTGINGKKKYNSGLTFSYFRGTGQYQRRYIYRMPTTFSQTGHGCCLVPLVWHTILAFMNRIQN